MTDFSGFYKLTVQERMKLIKENAGLNDDETRILQESGALKLEIADKMVENVIGAVHLPLGLGMNFVINGKSIVVPMAVEEASVIAAASRAAKQALPEGFIAEADEPVMIGQIQTIGVKDTKKAVSELENSKKRILEYASEFMKPHERYGCGVQELEIKQFKTSRGNMIVVDIHVAVGDAQGANMVNTTMEGVAPVIESITKGKTRLRIVSNLATKRLARAKAIWKKEIIGQETIDGVLDAYEFAKADVYRCATHNKGIMNGLDAVVMATGNDWRSVEAGAHSYAATKATTSKDRYQPLTHYELNKNGDLVGSIELPLALGIVGPAVTTSPTAKIVLKILGVKSSKELAMVAACVGLANNFAALSALSTVGIQQGHMKLHARSIAVYAGARGEEAEEVAEILAKEKNFNIDYAKEVIQKIRKIQQVRK
ncbi:hydroxymethylglutaryl-CoA reductase, degradative [Candidatus Micrarchaeota archaeon]|nr:hydroxymethylglutaryl-CoA reductase, degradative [Candidatus Micrarchaeota archaeon]